MGAAIRSNNLVKIVFAVVVVLTVLIVFKGMSKKDNNGVKVTPMTELPKVDKTADADTTADTVRQLTEQVKQLQSENVQLTDKSKQLLQQKESIKKEVERELAEKYKQDNEKKFANFKKEQSVSLAQLQSRIDDVVGSVKMEALKKRTTNARGADEDFPVGLGVDMSPDDAISRGEWVNPLDTPLYLIEEQQKNGGIMPAKNQQSSGGIQPAVLTQSETKNKDDVKKVITIPQNATLLGAKAWSALLGRIPVKGKLIDPFNFKVLVGSENLAANGITIPGLRGMVFSGVAQGDWNLSCVRGDITSALFVFEDGTIVSYDGKEGQEERIGTISDKFGIPCIGGELKTNVVAFLSSRIGLAALETAGAGLAATATSTQFNANGGALVNIDDVGDYTLGQVLRGGSAEARKWVEERQEQSFEAVFVKPGVELSLHIDEEIAIDLDKNARKVSYENSSGYNVNRNLD